MKPFLEGIFIDDKFYVFVKSYRQSEKDDCVGCAFLPGKKDCPRKSDGKPVCYFEEEFLDENTQIILREYKGGQI